MRRAWARVVAGWLAGVLLRMVLVVAGWLPLAVAEAGGRALGSAVAASRAYRWAVAVENVAVALPGTTDRGAAEVAAEALAHLGAVAALLPHAGAMGAAAAAGTGGDVAAVAAELTGQPAIVVSAHVGWWEALPAAVGTWLAPEQLMWVAYAPLADVALDAAVAAVRAAAVPQMRLIPARGAYKVLDAALRRGDVVGLMGDAFAPVAVATGPPVVFAGRRLRGRTGAARLAAATGAPVYAAAVLGRATAPRLVLERVACDVEQGVYPALDALVAAAPGTYLWTHDLGKRAAALQAEERRAVG